MIKIRNLKPGKDLLVWAMVILSLVCFRQPSWSQAGGMNGLPFITYYSPQTYQGSFQIWSIIQGSDGLMYFGNSAGIRGNILQYDGVTWRRIKTNGTRASQIVRCFGRDDQGTIYYGGLGNFGYLSQDSTGETQAVSLLPYIPVAARKFYDIWSLQVAGRSVYFQSRERLFRLTRKSLDFRGGWTERSWEPQTHFMYSFYLDGVLYVHQQGLGLFRMIHDSLVLVPGSGFLGSDRVQVMLPYPGRIKGVSTPGTYLLGTFTHGLFLYDGHHFTPFHSGADPYLHSSVLYKGLYQDGHYIFITANSGAYIINRKGKLLQRITIGIGLKSNALLAMYLDQTGNLWLGGDKGIDKLALNSRFTRFGEASGLTSTPLSVMRSSQGIFFAGTSSGLFRFDSAQNRFQQDTLVPIWQVFQLLKDGQTLLIPSIGLYEIKGNKTLVIRPSLHNDLDLATLMISKRYPKLLLAGTTFGLTVFTRDAALPSGWTYLGYIPHISQEVPFLAEDKPGNLWAGTLNRTVYRIVPRFAADGSPVTDKFQIYSYREGQPDLETPGGKSGILNDLAGPLFQAGDQVLFMGDSTLFHFDPSRNLLVRDTSLGVKPGLESRISADSLGDLYFRMNGNYVIAKPRKGGSYLLDSSTLRPLNDQILTNMFHEPGGILWFCTENGLIRFDPNRPRRPQPPFRTLIRRVLSANHALNPQGPAYGKKVQIAYRDNSFRFEFAAPYFDQESKTQYQTRMLGFDTGWSSWGKNTYKEYTNLPFGPYVFQVRARTLYHRISEPASFAFRISPPWYRSWWAYLVFGLLVLASLRLLIKWRTRQLEIKHRQLEQTIRERTAQLSERLEELALISRVQEALAANLDSQAIYEEIGDHLRRLFLPDSVLLTALDADGTLQQVPYCWENGQVVRRSPGPPDPVSTHLARTGGPVLFPGESGEIPWPGMDWTGRTTPPQSGIFVPWYLDKRYAGYLGLQDWNTAKRYGDSDLRLLETLANSMSLAQENSRLFEETRHLLAEAKEHASELGTVNQISRAISSMLDPQDLIRLVGEQIRELFRANIAYLALLDKKTQIIDFSYQFGESMPSRRIGEGLTSRILLSGEPLLINKEMDQRKAELGIRSVGYPAASYLGVPIPVGGEIIGVISVQSTEQENRFDEDDQRLLGTIASSVGIALRNAQLFRDLQLAKLDAESAGKAAEKANEAKSAFLSTVSHELRTPLTSVLGFAKIIRKRLEERIFPQIHDPDPRTAKATEQINENLKVVISEGERLTHLINDVLDLAKIEAGKMEWSSRQVSMAEVVDRAIAATTSLFENKPVQLVRELEGPIPEITGDPDKLIQVVINLFSNAIKFTKEGSVSCRVSGKDGGVLVRVIDTGIGIAAKDFEAVFEQFKQVGGDTLTDKPKGTGLGLPICKEIIEHHGGRIWVESEVGRGSIFSFFIPASPEISSGGQKHPIALEDLVNRLKQQIALPSSALVPNHACILIVDDDESIRSLLKQELEDAGYRIQEAENGKKALESIRSNRPDLILLDVMMPEMNGFDLAAILKNDPQTMQIPIVILSIVQDKTRGYRIGVDRYLTKPFNTEELVFEISHLLEQGPSKRKVMIVDEDEAAIRSLTEVLVSKGYQVEESDGSSLLEHARQMQPDIIILSSELSGKNDLVMTLRFEKGMEKVLFLIYQ